MRAITHPEYVYRPLGDDLRRKMSDAHLARLGTPLGHRRAYGTIMPADVAMALYPMLNEMCRTDGRDATEEFARKFLPASPAAAEVVSARFFAERRAQRDARRAAKAQARTSVERVIRVKKVTETRAKRDLLLETALEDAMLLYDEGLPPDQISKALHLPRTKILARIRATRRA